MSPSPNPHDDPPAATVLVAILNYRTSELSRAAALSALMSSETNVDVLIIDNGSEPPMDLGALGPRCFEIRLPRNLGFAGGHNRGLAWARRRGYEWVCLLNSDATLATDAIDHMLAAAYRHPRSLVCPAISDGEHWWYRGGDADSRRCRTIHFDFMRELSSDPESSATGPVPTSLATGCCVLASIHTWEQLHGLDESLFLYWEDFELTLQARKKAIPVILAPSAHVQHGGAGSSTVATDSDQLTPSFYYHYFRSRGSLIRRGDTELWKSLLATPALIVEHLRHMNWSPRRPGLLLRQLFALLKGVLAGLLSRTTTRTSSFPGQQ